MNSDAATRPAGSTFRTNEFGFAVRLISSLNFMMGVRTRGSSRRGPKVEIKSVVLPDPINIRLLRDLFARFKAGDMSIGLGDHSRMLVPAIITGET